MAEVAALVGLVAAIAQFLEYGTRLAERLREISASANDLPTAFSALQVRLPAVIGILSRIQVQVGTGGFGLDEAEMLLPVIENSNSHIKALVAVVEKVTPVRAKQRAKVIANERRRGPPQTHVQGRTGFDIRCVENELDFDTPFTLGRMDMCQFLISEGADLTIDAANGSNVIERAWFLAQKSSKVPGDYVMCDNEVLREVDLDDFVSSQQYNTIHKIVLGITKLRLLDVLETSTADIDGGDIRGATPLWWASSQGNLDAVRILLENGASHALGAGLSQTPLHVARDAEVVRVLLQHGAQRDCRDTAGRTPLHCYCYRQIGASRSIVREILDAGASANAVAYGGQRPLHYASTFGNTNLIPILLEYGADIDAVKDDGMTPLMAGVRHDQLDVVKVLLEKEADCRVVNKIHQNILHLAAIYAGDDCMTALASSAGIGQVHPSVKDAMGYTPLEYFERRKFRDDDLDAAFLHLLQKAGQSNMYQEDEEADDDVNGHDGASSDEPQQQAECFSMPGSFTTHGHEQDKKPITRSTPRNEKMLRNGLEKSPRSKAARGTGQSALAVAGDEEDEDLVMVSPAKLKKTTSPTKAKTNTSIPVAEEEDESDEDDEYLRALKQKAREKARLQRLGLEPENVPSPLSTGRSSATPTTATRAPSIEQSRAQSSRPVSASSGRDFGRTTTATPVPTEQEDDPQVRILIQSDIPDTKPLVVMRKASQSLKQVREFWCKRWQLDDAVAKKVFLTWRGTRLFDSTTTRGILKKLKEDYRQQSLGLGGDNDGDEDDVEGDHDHDPSKGNILLEAMTPEIYEEKMRQKEKLQRHNRASSDDDDADDSDEAEAGVATSAAEAKRIQEAESSIVIHLVNPAYEPMHLRVRPHTTVAKIMRGYAATKKLEENKTPWLIFDGERLDPEATVEDVGLEDEDEVDVSIR
ncbi:hypothetical protein KCU88_g4646, partial [Aureobasidium melanogenum]